MSRAKRKQFNVEEEGEASHGSYKVILVNNTCTVKEALEQAGCVHEGILFPSLDNSTL